MANTIRDYSATPANNTVVDGADISEGCSPAGINDAIRGVMSDLKDVSTGAVALESPAADSLSVTGNVSAATFSGDGSSLTGIPTPTLTSLGIANHNLATVDGSGNLNVTGAITTDGLTSEAANGTITSKAAGASFCSFTANTSAGNNAYVFFQQAGTEMSRISAYNGDILAFSTGSGAAERMRIDGATGNVGIGCSPAYNLDVYNSASTGAPLLARFKSAGGDTQLYVDNSTITTQLTADSFSNSGIVGTKTNHPFVFRTNNTERMRLDTAGRLLVNATVNNVAGSSARSQIRYSKTGEFGLHIRPFDNDTGGGQPVLFQNQAGGSIGSISATATNVAYNTSSDYRLKTAVNYDWDATTRLKQLRPARFEWISDGDNAVPVDGFLAHEVQDVVPEAITGTKDAMRDEEYTVSAATGDIYTPAIEAVLDDDGNEVTPAVAEVIHSTDAERPEELAEGQQWRETTAAVMGTRSVPDYQGIDQSKLVPLLVKTIQELEARITALEA